MCPVHIIENRVSCSHYRESCVKCRCATAFQVKEVCLVGSRQFNAFGSHGADAYVTFRHFETLEECVEVLKKEEGRCACALFLQLLLCLCISITKCTFYMYIVQICI